MNITNNNSSIKKSEINLKFIKTTGKKTKVIYYQTMYQLIKNKFSKKYFKFF